MNETELALPPAPEHPLLAPPENEKLRLEVEDLRHKLEEERKKNEKYKPSGGKPNKRTLWIIALILLAVLLAAFFIGYLPHANREKQLKQDAEAEAKALPVVAYFYAERSPAQTQLILPGNIEAITEAPVLARATGYLKQRYVDIGDRVRAGQLLAEIAAPDLDQQVVQARAQLLQASASLRQSMAALEQGKANQALSKVTAERWAGLLRRGAVSPQDNDSKQADYQAQTANVVALQEAVAAAQQNTSSMEANLNRLIELQSYEQVRAPFSGVITLRNIDTGALIGNDQTLLFRIAQTDRLRTYVYVPESNARLVTVGQKASIRVEEYPGREFAGEITRTSDALDPGTRTLLTEVQVPNTSNALSPGMFSEVALKQARTNPPVLIPGDALMVRSDGTYVGVLQGDVSPEQEKRAVENQGSAEQSGSGGQSPGGGNQDKQKGTAGKEQGKEKDDRKDKEQLLKQQEQLPTLTVHLEPVTIGRDYGNAIEILTGLNGGERVVQSPNDHVEENAKVKGQKSKDNPINPAGGQKKQPNANNEQLNPKQPDTEPAPKQPAKENTNHGPG